MTYSGWWTKASGLMTLYPLRPRALKTRAATLASDLTINPSCYRRDASLESDLIASRFVDLGLCQRKRAYFTQRNARAAHPQTEPFMLKGEKVSFRRAARPSLTLCNSKRFTRRFSNGLVWCPRAVFRVALSPPCGVRAALGRERCARRAKTKMNVLGAVCLHKQKKQQQIRKRGLWRANGADGPRYMFNVCPLKCLFCRLSATEMASSSAVVLVQSVQCSGHTMLPYAESHFIIIIC